MEIIEDLNINGLRIYQDDNLYKFTSDSVILTKFAKVKKNDLVADFCAGSGIVGFHLFALNPCIKNVTFFEIQTSLYELSKKSIVLNNLSDKFNAVNIPLQQIGNEYNEKFSLIICNPPYMESSRGETCNGIQIAKCKFEQSLSLDELLFAISKCLKFGGRMCLIHRADRLVDVLSKMRQNKLEPKRLQFVSGGEKEPYAFMVEGVKGGKSGIKVLKNYIN